MTALGLLVREYHPFTGITTRQVKPDECWKCERPEPDLHHLVMEYVAATLAQPLRDAFSRHLDEHGCADSGRGGIGFGHCDEAMRLFGLLPDWDRVVVA